MAARLSDQAGAALLDAARQAFTSSMNVASLTGAVVMATTAILAVGLLRRLPAPGAERETTEETPVLHVPVDVADS